MSQHILIVDDEAEIRELLVQFLTVSGYRTSAVATASEALAVAQATPPDLVISDLQLEESDGLDLIAKLKAITPDLPAILLTSVLFDRQTVAENLSQKISAYLPKTTPLTQLLAEIRRLLAAGK
jgi:CheY-like chemotaxis protein